MVVDLIAIKYLNFTKKRHFKGVDLEKPIQLINQYVEQNQLNDQYLNQIVAELIGCKLEDLKPTLIDNLEYQQFKQQINDKLTLFEGKPYQLGAIDLEIDAIATALYQFEHPSILEIGVANGYSSAFLYYILDKIGGTITSIDLPRFSSSLVRPSDYLRGWLVKKGKIKNTGTLGDINPGGIIPIEKYGGWLIPMHLRTSVKNITIYGDAFRVLEELPGQRFNFVVLDAMKGYDSRLKIMEMIVERLYPNSLCFIDGYWVNSAFEDFCKKYNLPSWSIGRVGVFSTNILDQAARLSRNKSDLQ